MNTSHRVSILGGGLRSLSASFFPVNITFFYHRKGLEEMAAVLLPCQQFTVCSNAVNNLHKALTVWPSVCVARMLVDTFLVRVQSHDAQPVYCH